VAGGEEHPALEPVAHLVHLVLDGDDLAGEAGVVVEEGRVGEAHGDLREVLHLDEDVHRPLELVSSPGALTEVGATVHRRQPGHLPDLGHTPSGGPCMKSTSPALRLVLGSGSKSTRRPERTAMGPHARLPSARSGVLEASAVELALRVDAHDRLVSSSAAGRSWSNSGGMPSFFTTILAMSLAALPIFSIVLHDLQGSGHLLRSRRATGGEDRQGAHVEDEVVQTVLEAKTSSR
jgi:hypothetical protein